MGSTTTEKRLVVLAILAAIFVTPAALADIISYSASTITNSASLGSTAFGSCPSSNPDCVEVTVYFLANTADIVPFSVPGASGFENFTGQGRVSLFNDQTGQSLNGNFAPNTIYVSVDQTNGGIGFGSSVGPTYPLGVYGANPSVAAYDLRSAFHTDGFSWFCPAGTCSLGTPAPPLATDQGDLVITPIGPAGSSFTATVIEVTPKVPEPSSVVLIAMGMTSVLARRGRSRLCRK